MKKIPSSALRPPMRCPPPVPSPGMRGAAARPGTAPSRTGAALRGVVAALAAIALLLLVAWSRCGVRGCPDVDGLAAYQYGGGAVLLDRAGRPFGRLTPLDRETVPLGSLPPYVPEAFVAVEDKRFLEHGGVDWRRIPGALMANLRARSVAQGFSTITMQLARNVFPNRLPGRERTLRRKLLEIRVAGQIEDRFTKDEILELYLNHIYFGGGAYGVEAAARHFFGKGARELSLAEATTLAALPRAPDLYDPRRHPERARARRDLVLTLMAAQGRVDPAAADAARETALRVPERPPRSPDSDGFAPYFVEAVRDALERALGRDLYHDRLRVHTTLDRDLQAALEEEMERQLAAIERGSAGRFRHPTYDPAARPESVTAYLQGAAVVLDARTGDVLALVGGRDQDQSAFDRALFGRRQVGSAFKPFVYATALAEGWTPADPLTDAPLSIRLATNRVYEPVNFDGQFRGSVPVREALVRSLNVPAVRLAQAVGTDRVATLARAAGFTGDLSEAPSMALGTVSASPMELALAYTPLATLGTAARAPRWVTSVERGEGSAQPMGAPETEAVLDPAVAYVVTDMLVDVVDRGTGSAVRGAGYRGVVAGKTGTTSDGRDAWFVGYTPDVVGVVWIGLDRPAPIVAGATGGGLAAPVWGRTMARATDGRAGPTPWAMPPGVLRMRIDPASGLVVTPDCWLEDTREELFLAAHVPASGCPERPRRGFFDRALGWLGDLIGGG